MTSSCQWIYQIDLLLAKWETYLGFAFFLEINLEIKVKDGAPPGCQLYDSPRRTAVVRVWAVGPAGVNQSLLLHSFRFS